MVKLKASRPITGSTRDDSHFHSHPTCEHSSRDAGDCFWRLKPFANPAQRKSAPAGGRVQGNVLNISR